MENWKKPGVKTSFEFKLWVVWLLEVSPTVLLHDTSSCQLNLCLSLTYLHDILQNRYYKTKELIPWRIAFYTFCTVYCTWLRTASPTPYANWKIRPNECSPTPSPSIKEKYLLFNMACTGFQLLKAVSTHNCGWAVCYLSVVRFKPSYHLHGTQLKCSSPLSHC